MRNALVIVVVLGLPTIAMAAITSTIVEDRAQVDGRRVIRERHVDAVGDIHFRSYLCPAAFDVQAQLAARGTELESRLGAQELIENEERFFSDRDFGVPEFSPNYTFRYTTIAENRARLRQLYLTSTGLATLRIARELNKLTNTQLQALFSYTNPQTTALRTKLTNQIALIATIRSQVGE